MMANHAGPVTSQDAVIATNDDAAQCKRYAVEKGYWTDPYISLMVGGGMTRHAPEINRGYFARIKTIQIMIEQFIKLTKNNCQIVNLGAGFETMYWRLKDAGMSPKSLVEVDFPTVTSRKCHIIKSRKTLLQKLSTNDGDIMMSKSELHADDYHLVSADLNNIGEFSQKLQESNIDKSLPTLFLSECVLVYMEPEKSEKLIKWISDNFGTAFFVNYEQVNMGDKFGDVMIQNLKSRNCYLLGVSACQSLETQTQRFLLQGWSAAEALPLSLAYKYLPVKEVERIERIEFLDERELLDQLFEHYCLCWAYKDLNNIGLSQIHLTQ